jgi:hypothetical protein
MKNLKKSQLRKQSLENKNKREGGENIFTNLTPRRGSLPSDFNRPLTSPVRRLSLSALTPKSNFPEFQEFKNLFRE